MRKWDDLSMREKAEMMRVAVSNGITTLPEIKQAYNEFAEGGAMPEAQPAENIFGKGGKKDNNSKSVFLNSLEQSLREDSRFNSNEWRKFFTDLAKMESSYSPDITNSIGAKGYFQLMPFNRAKAWTNPTQQFHEMYKLTGNNLKYLQKNLTEKDWEWANKKGIDMYGMLAGAHLGGVGNVVNAIRGKGNAKDMNGSSVIGYMTKFSQNSPTRGIKLHSPYKLPEQEIPFTPWNERAFYTPLTAYQPVALPDEQQPIVREAMAYDPKEIERQERQRGLNNFMTLMSMASPQQNNGMLGAISMLSGLGTTNAYREGGDIFIKPENRGKFTALKERTGHSATWFKEHGTPAQKKMATFALNARKWKHGDGGPLSNEQYYSIMERVAEENNPIWNQQRAEEGRSPLTIDEEYLRILNDNSYDYRGYYNKYPQSRANADTHWTDEFKTVYHPTFSDQSIYSGKKSQFNPEGLPGGMWVGETFLPKAWQVAEANKYANGGHIYDGTTEDSQQMNRPNIYRYNDGRYVYQAAPDAEEIEVSPINTLLPNPSQWTYQDAEGKVYTPHAAQVDTGSITQDEDTNPLLRAANNYMREAAYRAKDGTLALQGKYTMPAIAASALLPWAGEAFAGSTIADVPATTWANTAMTAGFAGHGLNHAINEGIDGWGDAAMTALEVAPLGRLARPMWNEAALAIENYRYPLGRPQVPEGYLTIKPQVRTKVGDVEIDDPNLLYHLDRGNGVGAFSNQGAYVENGMLLPGIAKEGEVPYSWWNLGRPYSTSVNGHPMTRLMTATEDTTGMLHVRSQNYPIGQWNGKRGFVTNAEYVNPEGVNVSGNTYTLDPNYGWRRLFAEDASTAKWADAVKTPQITAENELAQNESLKNMFRRILRGKPDDIKITKEMAEMGRKDLLNEISSPWYKERWKKATNGNDEQIDELLSRMRDRIIDVPIDYSKTTEQLGGEPGFVTYGVTVPREPHKFNLSDGTPVTDYNTGLDVLVAANRGKEARNTAYHELQHYLTNKATGTTPYPSLKFINNGPYEPLITPLDNGELLIGRGDAWQHYIMDQNEALLPKKSLAHEEAVYYPESLKKRITELGRTPEEADNLILKLRDEAQDMMSIQEQRAHLKTWFTKNILPHLKNPNDASEIERVLNEHPSIMKNIPENIKTLMETLRPGSVKDYAKYLAESLGIIPFINKNSKAE